MNTSDKYTIVCELEIALNQALSVISRNVAARDLNDFVRGLSCGALDKARALDRIAGLGLALPSQDQWLDMLQGFPVASGIGSLDAMRVFDAADKMIGSSRASVERLKTTLLEKKAKR